MRSKAAAGSPPFRTGSCHPQSTVLPNSVVYASSLVAECRRAAFVPVGHWPFHSVHRIAADSVAFAEIIEERGQRRELAPNAGRRQTASFHVLAPGNNMRPAYGT